MGFSPSSVQLRTGAARSHALGCTWLRGCSRPPARPCGGQAGELGGVLLGAAGKEHTLCGTAASPCRFQGLSQTLPMAVPPDPMQSGFWGPLFTSSFSCHPSQQPGKVGPPVPMFLTGMWKPRREPVEASRIQNTSV